MSTTIFSHAFNFPPVSSSVNHRTGAVDISFPLANISSGLQTPASFTLALNYRPGSVGAPYGFGGNWIPNTPRIDFGKEIIYLSNGSAEKYTGEFQLQYHRLKDIKIDVKKIVEMADGSNISYENYIVTHKNGVIEYMNELGRITRLVSASGHYLDFTYENNPDYARLLKIEDGNGNHISIDWNGLSDQQLGGRDNTITITQMAAGETKSTKVYVKENFGQLDVNAISLPNSESDRFKFEYTELNGVTYISKFTNPNGQQQVFSYGNVPYADGVTIPVVNKVETMGASTGEAGKSTVTYEYSSNNFTGYSPGRSMQPWQDNCILRTDEYTYDVTEKHSDIKIVRTFNRFHLLVSETQSGNSVEESLESRTVKFSYPLIPESNINEQPPIYALWIRKDTVFQDAAGTQRNIYQIQAFNESGNLLSQRRANGIIDVYTYYPAAGADGCPADPHGFVKYIKNIFTTKDFTTATTGSGKHTKKLELRYQAVRGLDYATPKSGMQSTTLILPEKTTVNGIEMETTGYVASADGSADATSRDFIGMPAWTQSVSSDQTYKTSFEYSSNNGLATVKTKYESITGDQVLQSKEKSKVFSLSSGLTQSETDFNGAVTNYQYDAQGRLTRQVNYAGTPVEQVETISYASYQAIDGYQYQNVVTTTRSNGVQYIDYFNFNNQLSYAFEKLPQGQPVLLKSMQYNNVGLLESETSYDTATDINGAAKAIAISTSYLYHLRNVSRKMYADGGIENFGKNAALNQETSQRNDGAITTTTYDDAGNIVSIKISTDTGNTHTTLAQYTYDGFGRKTQSINATGGVTRYSYDVFDRLLTETVENSDSGGRVDINSYTYSSVVQNMALPISVTSTTKKNGVEETILSETRMYDGFGRLIKQGNRDFIYANSYDERPATSGVGDAVITETADPTTSMVSSIVRRGHGDTRMNMSYVYDDTPSNIGTPPTLQLREAISSQNNIEQANFQYTYNDRGQVSALSSMYAGGATVSLHKTFSASGERLLTAINHLGKMQRYFYSASTGKLLMKLYDDLGIKLFGNYAANGNLIRVKLRSRKFGQGSSNSTLAFDMGMGYNAFNLEAQRSFKFQFKDGSTSGDINKTLTGDSVLEVQNTYAANTLLGSRDITKSGPDNVLKQNYYYQGAYGHLSGSNTLSGNVFNATTYVFAGGQRFSGVQETGKDAIVYSYTDDAPSSVFDGVTTTEYNRDSLGNITNAVNGTLSFDAANSLVKAQQDSSTYQYAYDPFGQLSQIKNDVGDSIIYLYDEGKLIGEMSGNTKTLYLTFGDITIGRYIACTTSDGTDEQLELYGTDSAGSVRYIKRIAAGGTELSSQYFDYSDYGVQTPG